MKQVYIIDVNKRKGKIQLSKLPLIQITFCLSGDEFNLDEVSSRLNIKPTETKKRSEFPIKEWAHTYWALSTQKEHSRAISIQFKKIIDILSTKVDVIIDLCREKDLEINFIITIYMLGNDRPEIVLTKEIVKFISLLSAEVDFDFYID